MFILYYKPTCPFCQRVLEAADKLNVQFDLRDISDDEAFVTELLEKGGKRQVPYLVDTTTDVSLYESEDIVEYITKHSSTTEATTAAKPRVHVGGSTCESCEG